MKQIADVGRFYEEILGIHYPWQVVEVDTNNMPLEVIISIEYDPEASIKCPECGREAKRYDTRERTLRHLDTCNYQTLLKVKVPRVSCEVHKVQQIPISFAEKGSRFTVLFEMLALGLLQNESVSAVGEELGLSWDEVNGIKQRAIDRGLKRRNLMTVRNMGIDETSYQKGHKYITVIMDKDRGIVLDVLPDRKAETLSKWFRTQNIGILDKLQSISMDMWDPFIKAVKENIANAEKIIVFDRFHVAGHFNKALDKVRSQEHQSLKKECGESPLTNSRYSWLKNSDRTDNRTSERRKFLELTRLHLMTARAWQIKETAATLWDYCYTAVVERNWKKLLGWISRCRIPEMIKVGKTVRNYLWGILNAIRLRANNSILEARNGCIQRLKRLAYGFRNQENFRRSILFHLGGLRLFPSTL
jgi:transposase